MIGINAGKNSLIYRCNNIYPPPIIDYDTYDFIRIPLTIDKKEYLLLIESYDFVDNPDMLTSFFYQGDGILLVFGIDNKESFEKLKEIKEKIKVKNIEGKFPMLLVGNKKDLEDERKISFDEAKSLAELWGIEYLETSAKNNYNCKEVFEKIARFVLEYRSISKGIKVKDNKKKSSCLIY